jgi:dTDP-4-dehydrorhamnose 3,5-epimerase
MRFESTPIDGVILFIPEPHSDARGFFSRTFDVDVARAAGVDPHSFLQDSVSRSHKGVIRGLHVRLGQGEAKLVRCSSGRIFDVVVDLRPWSSTYGRWLSFDLTDMSQRSVYIPAGCAHGFQALTASADTSYRIDRQHNPSDDLTIAYDDPELAIPWPLPPALMSPGDHGALPMTELGQELSRIRPRDQ